MNLHTEFSVTSARTHLNDAKRELIGLIAMEKQARRSARILKERVAEYERYAKDALALGEDSLAGKIAERITVMASEFLLQQKENDSFEIQVNRLKNTVHRLERRVDVRDDQLQYMLDCLDASAELQQGSEDLQLSRKMQAAGIGKPVGGAGEILARIRAKRILAPW